MEGAGRAEDLKLYIENDGKLYQEQTVPLRRALERERAGGGYRHEHAVEAYMALVEIGAKRYVAEFGGTVNRRFPSAIRKVVAEELADAFEAEASLGNYDYLLEPAEGTGARSPAALEREIAGIVEGHERRSHRGRDRAARRRADDHGRVHRRAR